MNNFLNLISLIITTASVLSLVNYSITEYNQKPRDIKTGRYTKKPTSKPSKPKKRLVPVYDGGVFSYNIKI